MVGRQVVTQGSIMFEKDDQMFLKDPWLLQFGRGQSGQGESRKEAFGDLGQRMVVLHHEGGWGEDGEWTGFESLVDGGGKAKVSDVCQASDWCQGMRGSRE